MRFECTLKIAEASTTVIFAQIDPQDQQEPVRGISLDASPCLTSHSHPVIVVGEAYATFLDFDKAYDHVHSTFMFRVLKILGVGKTVINWVCRHVGAADD